MQLTPFVLLALRQNNIDPARLEGLSDYKTASLFRRLLGWHCAKPGDPETKAFLSLTNSFIDFEPAEAPERCAECFGTGFVSYGGGRSLDCPGCKHNGKAAE